MSPHQAQLIEKIQAATAASPELQKKLATAQSTQQIADALTQALGTPVTQVDLKDISHAAQQQMTDEQLDAVAGGGEKTPGILLSVFTLGAGCALVSAVTEVLDKHSGGCKGFFS